MNFLDQYMSWMENLAINYEFPNPVLSGITYIILNYQKQLGTVNFISIFFIIH